MVFRLQVDAHEPVAYEFADTVLDRSRHGRGEEGKQPRLCNHCVVGSQRIKLVDPVLGLVEVATKNNGLEDSTKSVVLGLGAFSACIYGQPAARILYHDTVLPGPRKA